LRKVRGEVRMHDAKGQIFSQLLLQKPVGFREVLEGTLGHIDTRAVVPGGRKRKKLVSVGPTQFQDSTKQNLPG